MSIEEGLEVVGFSNDEISMKVIQLQLYDSAVGVLLFGEYTDYRVQEPAHSDILEDFLINRNLPYRHIDAEFSDEPNRKIVDISNNESWDVIGMGMSFIHPDQEVLHDFDNLDDSQFPFIDFGHKSKHYGRDLDKDYLFQFSDYFLGIGYRIRFVPT
jgi:hypothetical protein